MLIWQKYFKVLGQVSSTLPSSTSKYQVLLNFKVSSTSKYQVLEILHQVPSTKYKYFTWPQPWFTVNVIVISLYETGPEYLIRTVDTDWWPGALASVHQ